MNPKTTLLPVFWLVSLSAAYIIGSKMKSPTQETVTDKESIHDARASYREKSSSPKASSRAGSSSKHASNDHKPPLEKVKSILLNNDPITRANDLLKLIKRLDSNGFAQVITDFQATGMAGARQSEYAILLHAWAKIDPVEALYYAERNSTSNFARQKILASWAAENPDSAIQWVESNYLNNDKNPWLAGIVQGIVDTDTQKATQVLNSMTFSTHSINALKAITPHISRLSQQEVTQWLSEIESSRLRANATGQVAELLAHTDPEATSEWVNSLESAQDKSNAINKVALAWATQDLPKSMAWVASLSDTEQAIATNGLISHYAKEDPEQASAWLDNLINASNYDTLATKYITNTIKDEPELALAKVPTLKSEARQRSYYNYALSSWINTDSNAAEAWMKNNDVSDELYQRIVGRKRQ